MIPLHHSFTENSWHLTETEGNVTSHEGIWISATEKNLACKMPVPRSTSQNFLRLFFVFILYLITMSTVVDTFSGTPFHYPCSLAAKLWGMRQLVHLVIRHDDLFYPKDDNQVTEVRLQQCPGAQKTWLYAHHQDVTTCYLLKRQNSDLTFKNKYKMKTCSRFHLIHYSCRDW